jgi:hypothetical protein
MRSIGRLACAAACVALLAISVGCGAAPAKKEAPPAAAKAKVASPGQVASMMKQARFEVAGVYRNGAAYVVKAKGPSGNEVLAAVDGRTGKIIGMDVVKWAPGAKRVKRGSRGGAFTGDVYEFGVVVPVAALATWVTYEPVQWATSTDAWIEVETTTTTWSEVTYEEGVTEVAYESYVEEYTEDYGVELDEAVSAYEVAEADIEDATVTETTEVNTVETAEVTEEVGQADAGAPEAEYAAADDAGADDGGDAGDAGAEE